MGYDRINDNTPQRKNNQRNISPSKI